MAAELSIDPGTAPGTLALAGELDTHTAPQLARALEGSDDGANVTLDLSATTFISSAGLTVMLNAQRRLLASGGSLRVVDPTPPVARMIELSGLAATLGLDRLA